MAIHVGMAADESLARGASRLGLYGPVQTVYKHEDYRRKHRRWLGLFRHDTTKAV